MDVILHLGAHRTGTTTFQHYMRQQSDAFAHQGIGFWGPQHTRKVIFPGLFRTVGIRPKNHPAHRAAGRVRMMAQQAENAGLRQLVVSDENLIGSCAHNLRQMSLYPAIGERVARVMDAFGGRAVRVVLSVRAQDLWWASASALAVSRGHPVPTLTRCAKIANSGRTWRDVIGDLACAAPGAEIRVLPFEQFGGRPDALARVATGGDVPADTQPRWLNRSAAARDLRKLIAGHGETAEHIPDTLGRWHPFTPEQRAALREDYADDLHWLTAGADGLATLTEDSAGTRADTSLPPDEQTKGQIYDNGQGQFGPGDVAQHR